jgi:hypothetical protein
LRAEVAADTDSNTPEDRAVLEQILERDPKNASLLARLGNAYRRVDPVKSRDFYLRALQLEPRTKSMLSVTPRRWSNPGNSAKRKSSCDR